MPAVGGAPSPFPTTPTLPHGARSTAARWNYARLWGTAAPTRGRARGARTTRGGGRPSPRHQRRQAWWCGSASAYYGGRRARRGGCRGELRRRTREGDVRLRWPWSAPRCGPSQGEERQNEARRERLVRREQRRHDRGMQGRLNRAACGEERGCHGQRPAEGCLAVEVGEGWRELGLIPYWKLKNSN